MGFPALDAVEIYSSSFVHFSYGRFGSSDSGEDDEEEAIEEEACELLAWLSLNPGLDASLELYICSMWLPVGTRGYKYCGNSVLSPKKQGNVKDVMIVKSTSVHNDNNNDLMLIRRKLTCGYRFYHGKCFGPRKAI